MKISELIKHLEKIRTEQGDLKVKVQTMNHLWDADVPIVRQAFSGPVVLLNQ